MTHKSSDVLLWGYCCLSLMPGNGKSNQQGGGDSGPCVGVDGSVVSQSQNCHPFGDALPGPHPIQRQGAGFGESSWTLLAIRAGGDPRCKLGFSLLPWEISGWSRQAIGQVRRRDQSVLQDSRASDHFTWLLLLWRCLVGSATFFCEEGLMSPQEPERPTTRRRQTLS